MAYTRRVTTADATWARAWTADTTADLTALSALTGSERPHHGDIAYVTADTSYYLWMDDGTWRKLELTGTVAAHHTTHETGGTDAITVIAEGIITDGSLLARVAANETISGDWAFNGTRQKFQDNSLVISETTAAVNNKHWRLIMSGGTLFLQVLDDAYGSGTTIMAWFRSGTTPSYTRFDTQTRISDGSAGTPSYSFQNSSTMGFYRHAADYLGVATAGTFRSYWASDGTFAHSWGLRLNGRGSDILTADQTAWSPTGLGTTYYILIAPNAIGWKIKGITAQADGYIVTFINTLSNTFTFEHEDAAASAANRIYCPGAVALSVAQYGAVTLIYDGTTTRWRVLSNNT